MSALCMGLELGIYTRTCCYDNADGGILLETGDVLLMETGDVLLLETQV